MTEQPCLRIGASNSKGGFPPSPAERFVLALLHRSQATPDGFNVDRLQQTVSRFPPAEADGEVMELPPKRPPVREDVIIVGQKYKGFKNHRSNRTAGRGK